MYREEQPMYEKLCEVLANEFDIFSESEIRRNPGKFLLDGEHYKSIPDLILKPKTHLLAQHSFPDIVIPVEIKIFTDPNCNKFEDLLCQCHTYRFSTYAFGSPRLCLYFINNYFDNVKIDYEGAKNPRSEAYLINGRLIHKHRLETFMGRFGIGELLVREDGYSFGLKRQSLYQKTGDEIIYKPTILNFSLGTSGGRICYY